MVATLPNSVRETGLPSSRNAAHAFTPESAAEIIAWSFTEEDHRRIAELCEKSRAGMLTQDESAQLKDFMHVDNVMSLAMVRARYYLKNQAAKE